MSNVIATQEAEQEKILIAGFALDELRIFYPDGRIHEAVEHWSENEVEQSIKNGCQIPNVQSVIYNATITGRFTFRMQRIVTGKNVTVTPERKALTVNELLQFRLRTQLYTGSELREQEQARLEAAIAQRQERIAELQKSKRPAVKRAVVEIPSELRVLYAHELPLPTGNDPTEFSGKNFWLKDSYYVFDGLSLPASFIKLNANYAARPVTREIERLTAGLPKFGLPALTYKVVEKYYYKFRPKALEKLKQRLQ